MIDEPNELADAEGPPPAEVVVPESLRDRWILVGDRPLAARGQGTVRRVKDRQSAGHEQYALKEMRYDKGPTSVPYQRFVREINVMTKLSGTHPGIVPVIAHGIPADGDAWLPFYVMQLAEQSLERAKDLSGSLEAVLKIGVQLADALEAAHAQGVIHRDVKPANVLLFGDERRPALADFGICHLVDDDRLTRTDGQTVGSRDYVAPELLGGGRRESVTGRADVYSLGKTLYAALVGDDPFPRERHLEAEWNLGLRFNDPRYEHFHGLLDRMVVEDPNARFESMRACKEAMERALENVRAGRTYAPGMYGGERSAVERLGRAIPSIERLTGRRQEDAKLKLLEESPRVAKKLIVATSPPGRDVDYGYDALENDTDLAAQCADHLAVGGFVAILLGDDALLDEWWETTSRQVLKEGELRTRTDKILVSAAVGAAYCVGAAAWRRRRWPLLREITAAIAKNGQRFVHLPILDRSAKKSAEWLSSLIANSSLVAAVEPDLSDDPRRSIGIVSGLALLRDLLFETPNDAMKHFIQAPHDPISGVPHPALLPDFHDWVNALGEACLESTHVARGVASVLDAATPMAIRSVLQKVTPVMQRWMAQIAAACDRDFILRQLDKYGPWAEWINGAKRPA